MENLIADITRLAHDGRGIAHVDGKITFIDGALPGEKVHFRFVQRKKQFDQAQVLEVIHSSNERVPTKCIHAQICGGCCLQHISPNMQLELKQQILLDHLKHFGKLNPPKEFMPTINATPWGYRRKARLSVKYVAKKNRVLIGFHEKQGRYIAELNSCEILVPKIGLKLAELQVLISKLSIYNAIPQLELAAGDNAIVLIIRHLAPLTEDDKNLLREFAGQYDIVWYLQSGNASTLRPLDNPANLFYQLPEFDLRLEFEPLDFVQVNAEVNKLLVSKAIELLAIQPQDKILDLFCGLGNFSLAMARSAKQVIGVEGDNQMVLRAKNNAQLNKIANTNFFAADLSKGFPAELWANQKYDKVLIDPPRAGAFEILQQIKQIDPQRIVYVSCDPATFARDAGELIHNQGYQLEQLGILDMFPHTKHVETIGLFVRSH